MCSRNCWASVCLCMSATAVVFLIILAILCAQESAMLESTKDDIKTQKTSVIAVAVIYAVVFIICLLYLVLRSYISSPWKKPKRTETKSDKGEITIPASPSVATLVSQLSANISENNQTDVIDDYMLKKTSSSLSEKKE